jgi:hypothetical protein
MNLRRNFNYRKMLVKIKNLSLRQLLIILLVALILLTQLLSFIRMGEILGFKVREVNNSQNKGLKGLESVSKNESEKSSVCKNISSEFVSELVGKKVRSSSISADIKEPNLVSSCIYSTDPTRDKGSDSRSVTVSLKVTQDEVSAKDLFSDLKEKNALGLEDVKGFGDEAFFTPKLNRLTVRSSKSFINVFVKAGDQDALGELEVAKKIAEELL